MSDGARDGGRGGEPEDARPAGRKGRSRRRRTVKVPVGLEKLLFLAASDGGFRERLLADRTVAVAEKRIRLRPSEQAMLDAVPTQALEAMIARIVPENPWRRKFMRIVATAATSLAAGTASMSCDDCGAMPSTGVGPDSDVDSDVETETASGTDTGSDTGTSTDTGSDTDTSTDTDTDTGTDSDVDTDVDTDSSFGIGPDSDVDTDTDSNAR